jgi:hypothetical protein
MNNLPGYYFQGSNSIKSVLPVVVSDLSYDDPDIASGEVAQVTCNDMQKTTDTRTERKFTSLT